jgi:GNAT superfamily N-acetyltransferase
MGADVAVTIEFVGPDQAPVVRDLMRAAFSEYDAVLTVPSSSMWETVEDVADHIAEGGAVLASVGPDTVGSGRYALRDDHVYIGRLSVLPTHRGRGIGAAMMLALEQRALTEGRIEARISVRTMLPKNIELYERLGYVVTARYQHERGNEIVVDLKKQLR